ncbi:MAG: hypothetical protein JO127_18515 [Caulobacteraceae bacterium]|nr:hypothetical protein [Caulobacteraceae bacterium]
MRAQVLMIAASTVLLGACSTIMEAKRPDPVDITRFNVGENRMDVIARLGAPPSTVKDQDDSCDVYKLYTKGAHGASKGAVILGEATADVFTLGLAEVVTTPVEAASKSHQHTVLFCYGADDKVASITDEGKPLATASNAPVR